MASSPDAADGARPEVEAGRPGGVLSGRVAIVTGATGGIGRAAAERLAGAGAHVVLVARSMDDVRGAAAHMGGVPVVADVGTETGVARVAEAIGTLQPEGADIVVHAAGAFALAPLAETSVEAFDQMVAVNLRGAFLLVRAFLPAMLKRGAGHIVTIGSVAGRQAFPANGAYSASKFGVRGLHAVLAAELRGTGVRATFVEPSATDTALWEDIDRDRNAGLPSREQMLDPAAVADAVLYAVTRPAGTAVPNILVERA
ncbi:MAG TPA: SDR family oxidoreductase [Longimicrobiales bacterium]|nr:SDR family oxidoreductase [Longimicrobiales bacterium]